jgi:hypothetical protein
MPHRTPRVDTVQLARKAHYDSSALRRGDDETDSEQDGEDKPRTVSKTAKTNQDSELSAPFVLSADSLLLLGCEVVDDVEGLADLLGSFACGAKR